MEEEKAAIVLQVLRSTISLPILGISKRASFENMVTTIVSQKTSDYNSAKAFEALSKRIEMTPEAFAETSLSAEELVKFSEHLKRKAKAIKRAAVAIIKNYGGTFERILLLPPEKARKRLKQFPGVAPKTADILLGFSTRKKTVPVDTHLNRFAKRICFAQFNRDCEVVRTNLEPISNPVNYLTVPMPFIAHGRKTCKARHLLRNLCPVNIHCSTKEERDKS